MSKPQKQPPHDQYAIEQQLAQLVFNDLNGVKKRAIEDLFAYGIAITRTTVDGIENVNYEDVPSDIIDNLNNK